MSKIITFLYLVTVLILSMSVATTPISDIHVETRRNIMHTLLAKGDMKALFKAYHFAFGKTYDYNTEAGLEKYKTFKKNALVIKAHNADPIVTYKKGFNDLTDMTFEEVKKYYGLKEMTHREVERKFRNLRSVSLDDFSDEEESSISAPKQVIKNNVNHSGFMLPVKSQGECGSCWAFGTIAALEGDLGVHRGQILAEPLSTQQLVDCDTGNNGCNGGWYTNAFKYLMANGTIKDSEYKYTAKKETCQYDFKAKTDIKPTNYLFTNNEASIHADLLKGPLGVAIDANEKFNDYETGIWNAACPSGVSHAMVLIGYSVEQNAFTLRNSWGTSWGEKGNIRVLDQGVNNNNSCWIVKYGYRALFA